MVREPDKNDYLYSILFLGIIANGIMLFKFGIQVPQQISFWWDNIGVLPRLLSILGITTLFLLIFKFSYKKEILGILILIAGAVYSFYTGNAFWALCCLTAVISYGILSSGQTYFHNQKLAIEIQSIVDLFINCMNKNDFSKVENQMLHYDAGFEMRKRFLFDNHENGFIDKKLESSTEWKDIPTIGINNYLIAIAVGDCILSKLGVLQTTQNQKNLGTNRKEIENWNKLHLKNMKLHVKSIPQKDLQKVFSKTYEIKKELERKSHPVMYYSTEITILEEKANHTSLADDFLEKYL